MCKFKYIVRLRPVGSYFFGGEVTFGDGENQNYLVRSRILPQASALLGLMRYVILEEHNLLEKDDPEVRKSWPDLIGERSFSVEDPQGSYGVISSISPVFVEKRSSEANSDSELFTPCPMDYGYDVELVSERKISYSTGHCHPQCKITKVNGGTPFTFKDFDNYESWISSKEDSGLLKASEIFQYDERVGITKNDGLADDEKAYFKQTMIRMAERYNFLFTLETSEDILVKYESGKEPVKMDRLSQVVYLGGNRSAFKMTIEPIGDRIDPVEKFSKTLYKDGRVLLLSDAFIPAEERDKFDFIWGESIDNRYVSDTHKWRKDNRSSLYHLLGRGSVIYHSNKNELDALRVVKSKLNTVGLNIYV